MLLYTLKYGLLILLNGILAKLCLDAASDFRKDNNSAAIGAAVAGVANIFCGSAVLAIYILAMITGR